MKNIIIILSFIFSLPAYSLIDNQPTLNFFFDSSLNPKIGLSCNTEMECKNKCSNSEICQKEVPTCLSCIGAKSPYLNDFFNNIGELTTACFDQSFLNKEAESLFKYVSMVPIFPVSPYNPLGLKDFGLMLKFMSLCPAGTQEPVAIAFTDTITHSIREIPLVKCGQAIFPLVRLGEDCEKKADQIQEYILHEQDKYDQLIASYKEISDQGESVSLKYDVLQFSDFSEAQYLKCNETSSPICQNICHSNLSCVANLDNEKSAEGIAAFNHGQFTGCGVERFSTETLVNYLKSNSSFAFNSLSLAQTYDLPEVTNDFKDLSVINTILNNFAGVFKASGTVEDNSFFISNSYQLKIEAIMKSFCDESSTPFIMGHEGKIERVFCRSGQNGYFQILADRNENCAEKTGKLSISNVGVLNE